VNRVRLGLAALGALLVLAIPASAPAQSGGSVAAVLFGYPMGGKLISQTNVPINITGQLTVAFHGSAAAGCATSGVCPYSGTIVVRPRAGQLGIETYRRRGRIGEVAFLAFDPGRGGSTTVADVDRSVPGQPTGLCADAQTPAPAVISSPTRRGSLTVALLQAGGTVLSTRCAGPLDGDLASVSPQATIPLRAARRGGMSIDLSGSRPFASHGFEGTLDSTLVLTLGRPQSNRGQVMFPPGIRTQRVRTVIEHLRVIRAIGHLGATVQGTDNPLVCALLDSCGLTGSLSLGTGPAVSTGELIATGPASRPYADFLAALGLSRTGNRRGIAVDGDLELAPAGTITAALSQSGVACMDTAPAGGVAFALGTRGNALVGAGIPSGWRTRCPGPMLGALTGALSVLPFPRSELGRRTLTMHVRARGSLTDDGYSISLHGALSVTIGRGPLTQTVFPEPAG
jgi:hypothetical protein